MKSKKKIVKGQKIKQKIYYQRTRFSFPYPVPIRSGCCKACRRCKSKGEIKTTQMHHMKYAFETKTVRKNPLLALENTLELCFGCLPSNEKVYTSTGIREIENIKKNDEVTIGCSPTKVVERFVYNYENQIVEIRPKYFLPIKLTPEHPVLVALIKRKSWKNKYIFLRKPEFLRAGQLTQYNRQSQINLRVAIPKIKHSHDLYVDLGRKTIKFDRKFGIIVGTYLADGSYNPSARRIDFYFNAITEKAKANTFMKILMKNGFKSNIFRRKNVLVVYTCSVYLGRFLRDNFGKNSYEKTIPTWALEGTEDFLSGVIHGLLNDGWFDKKHNMTYISTVSENLARQTQLLLWKLRKPASVKIRKPNRKCIIEGRIVNEHPLFSITWSKHPSKIVEDEDYYWISIRKITITLYRGKIYNLATKAGIFTTPIIVHNCHPVADGFRNVLLSNPRGALRSIHRILQVAELLPEEQQDHFTKLCKAWLRRKR